MKARSPANLTPFTNILNPTSQPLQENVYFFSFCFWTHPLATPFENVFPWVYVSLLLLAVYRCRQLTYIKDLPTPLGL